MEHCRQHSESCDKARQGWEPCIVKPQLPRPAERRQRPSRHGCLSASDDICGMILRRWSLKRRKQLGAELHAWRKCAAPEVPPRDAEGSTGQPLTRSCRLQKNRSEAAREKASSCSLSRRHDQPKSRRQGCPRPCSAEISVLTLSGDFWSTTSFGLGSRALAFERSM